VPQADEAGSHEGWDSRRLDTRHGKSWADRRWCRDRTPGTSRPCQPVHGAVLRRAEGCDANRTSDRSSLRAVVRKFYASGEHI
jgi:hypothetical protein